jgi:sporulation protein YlmC with PRC-barrel domain
MIAGAGAGAPAWPGYCNPVLRSIENRIVFSSAKENIMKNTPVKTLLMAILVGPAMALSLPATSFANHHTGVVKDHQVKPAAAIDMRASKLIGKDVKNAAGESLGEIKDLMVDLKGERVHYAVLGFGGALGLGDKLFAYPVSAFRAGAGNDDLVLNVSKEKLKDAPGFDKDHWPAWGSDQYRRDVDRYHGNKAGSASAQLMRASKLIGKNVDDRAGKDAGEIKDLVVNLGTGRVRYAVLEFDKAWSLNDKLVALPMRAFTIPRDANHDLVVNVSRERISQARAFDKDHWPDMASAKYRHDMDAYLTGYRSERVARRHHAGDDAVKSSGQ